MKKLLFLLFLPFYLFSKDRPERYRSLVMTSWEGSGLFAVFNAVVAALDYYERHDTCVGLKVDFGERGVYYDTEKGPNWWEYYFEPIALEKKSGGAVRHISDGKQGGLSWKGMTMPRARAAQLMQKYIRMKPHIQKVVDEFARDHFGQGKVVGVHYRGTDKESEAPKVSYQAFFDEIQKFKPNKIFVATDEVHFLDAIKKEFPGKITYIEAMRSSDGQNVHHRMVNNYKKGEEAVVDCLLLSRCQVIICNRSNLNIASSRFNTKIPLISLNEMYWEKERKRKANGE